MRRARRAVDHFHAALAQRLDERQQVGPLLGPAAGLLRPRMRLMVMRPAVLIRAAVAADQDDAGAAEMHRQIDRGGERRPMHDHFERVRRQAGRLGLAHALDMLRARERGRGDDQPAELLNFRPVLVPDPRIAEEQHVRPWTDAIGNIQDDDLPPAKAIEIDVLNRRAAADNEASLARPDTRR